MVARALASRGALVALGLALTACGDTGQRVVTVPLSVAGTAASTVDLEGHAVLVEEARVAFGPLYFCAALAPGVENCATAQAESLGTTSFDALDPTEVAMTPLTALTGTLLSAMWDYGRSWSLADTEPSPSPDAVDGAHSAVLVIRDAFDDGAGVPTVRRYRFTLDVDGAGQPSGTMAARMRLASSHEVTRTEAPIVVRFDPTLWASLITADGFDALATLDDPGDGSAIDVPADHLATNALVQALTATGLPSFTFSD